MIQIQNLVKIYRKQVVLNGITIEFQDGMITGLIGPNGCGKTTLLRCICGFAKPTEGSVTVMGKRIGKDCDFAPSTGVIIESPGFYPHESARKNLEILAGASGKADQDRISEVIRCVGLDPDSPKKVGQYSLGMKQRLGIAQAILENPKVLILDEPFNGLDYQGIEDMHQLLQTRKKERNCILLVSHSRQDIEKSSDVIYEMRDGRLFQAAARI